MDLQNTEKPQVNSLAFVGGTHGNELTGVHTIPWLHQQQWFQESTLRLNTLIANPKAVELGRRYADFDLNRAFSKKLLNSQDTTCYEYQKAREINELLGPKGPHSQTDLLVDIHNSTANMGISLIIGAMDEYLFALCLHLKSLSDDVRVYYMPEESESSPYLPTIAHRDLCLEIGPQAHGLINYATLQQSQLICRAIVEFTEKWPSNEDESYRNQSLEFYEQIINVDYPRDENGEICALIHPAIQDHDYAAFSIDQQALFCDFYGKDHSDSSELDTLRTLLEGEHFYPVFVNEQAYYEKGIAMSITQKKLSTWANW